MNGRKVPRFRADGIGDGLFDGWDDGRLMNGPGEAEIVIYKAQVPMSLSDGVLGKVVEISIPVVVWSLMSLMGCVGMEEGKSVDRGFDSSKLS